MRNLIIFLLFLGFAAITGCGSLPFIDSPPPVPPHARTLERHQPIGSFQAIVIDGSMDVELDGRPTGVNANRLVFIATEDTVGTIEAKIVNNTLYLRNMNPLQPKAYVRARIQVPVKASLTSITSQGYGSLTGHNIRAHNFVLNIDGNRYVNLSGPNIGMKSINALGTGSVIVSNINTNHLNVTSHSNTRITLSGNATSTEIVLSKGSSLQARDLMTQTSYTNTADNASAEVRVVKLLNAFASGYSNIYYYAQAPELLNKYLRQNGSVLFFPAK